MRLGYAGGGRRTACTHPGGNRAGRRKEPAEGSPVPPGSLGDTPEGGEPFTKPAHSHQGPTRQPGSSTQYPVVTYMGKESEKEQRFFL